MRRLRRRLFAANWRSRRGFALLLVLWTTAALSVIAIILLRESSEETRFVGAQLEDAKAEALADGGVYRAMLGLMAQGSDQWNADGSLHKIQLGDGIVRIAITNEAGKIDLNRASDELLESLFTSVGAAPGDARKLAAAVEDFRDSDNVRRPGGAEAIDYKSAGLAYGPKNAPFESIEELRHVFGLTPAIFAAIRPLVTVYSPGADVDVTAAPEAVLRALPNLGADQRQQILTARSAGVSLSRPEVVTVTSEAETSGGGKFIREAILRRTNLPTRPYLFLSWRRTWPVSPPPQG